MRYLLLCLFVLLGGCGMGEAKTAADVTINKFYAALKAKDWEKVRACCSPQFFTKITKENYTKLLEQLDAKLGEYQSRQEGSYKYVTGSSTTFTIEFKVKYSKGETNETFTFVGSPSEEGYLITGHNIQSPQLLAPQQ
jgi:hypothetical protein